MEVLQTFETNIGQKGIAKAQVHNDSKTVLSFRSAMDTAKNRETKKHTQRILSAYEAHGDKRTIVSCEGQDEG